DAGQPAGGQDGLRRWCGNGWCGAWSADAGRRDEMVGRLRRAVPGDGDMAVAGSAGAGRAGGGTAGLSVGSGSVRQEASRRARRKRLKVERVSVEHTAPPAETGGSTEYINHHLHHLQVSV